MRVFGAAAYPAMMRLPLRAVARFAEIEGERSASQQLAYLRLSALSDGMEQGREYVPDPNEPKSKSKAHYSLKRYLDMEARLELRAEPWSAPERQRRQRVAEQEKKWAKMRRAMGAGRA